MELYDSEQRIADLLLIVIIILIKSLRGVFFMEVYYSEQRIADLLLIVIIILMKSLRGVFFMELYDSEQRIAVAVQGSFLEANVTSTTILLEVIIVHITDSR